jgi:ABC-type nitrate/sulfonate/bicarbonate transport system permease component
VSAASPAGGGLLLGGRAPTAAADRDTRRLGRGRRRLGEVVAPAAGLAIALALWIIGGRAGWANGMVVTPAETRDLYWRATQSTVWAAFRGLLIGGTLAFLAALLAAAVPSLRRAIARLAAIANAAPWVAVGPCLLVILGRDRGPTALAAIAVFFFVFVSASVGLGSAPRASTDMLHALGASRRLRLRALQLPMSLPSLVDGLRLAAPAAVAGTIFGEWYGAQRGLGVLLISGMQSGRPEKLWGASLISAALGLIAFGALELVRRAVVSRYGAAIAQAEPVRRPTSRLRSGLADLIAAVGVGAVLVTAWFVWIEAADVSPLVVPRPSRVWRDITDSPGAYWSATWATLQTAAAAFAIGVAIGMVVAVLAARSRIFAGAAVPVIVLLAATPLVALLPLFARVLGYNPSTVRLLAATMVFFPVFVYTRSGLAATRGPSVDVVHALGATAGGRFRLLTLPGAVPHIVSGCRLAAGSSIVAAVVGESLIGRQGLGVAFTVAYRQLELPRAFGVAIVIIVVSVLVFSAAGAAERAVHARWA